MSKEKASQIIVQNEYWQKDKQNRRGPHHIVVQATFAPYAALAASLVERPREASVLDVGCGNGFLTMALEKHFGRVVGLDSSPEMLKFNPSPNKHLGLSTALPFPDKCFDVVTASHLLHHLVESDRLRTLAEMARVAKTAVVSFEPNRNNLLIFLFSLFSREERMALMFSRSYVRGLFERAGLKTHSLRTEGWLVPNKAPVWWIPIGRFLNKTLIRGFGVDIVAVGSRRPTG